MVSYCENTTICRHKVLCEYFGDPVDEGNNRVGEINTFCDYACDIWYTRRRSKLITVGIQMGREGRRLKS